MSHVLANKNDAYENADPLEHFGAVMLRSQVAVAWINVLLFVKAKHNTAITINLYLCLRDLHKHSMVLLLTSQCSRARITIRHGLQVAFMN